VGGKSDELELIEHIPRVPSCIASATDGFHLGEIRSTEHAQDSLVQACAVVSSSFDRRGYDMQQKDTIFDTRGSYPSI
jgi:hypothetical protein